jgi:hypothetical protein
MLHFGIGDKVEVNDMAGIYEVISISYVNCHLLDLVLKNKGKVLYFVRRRKHQIKKI